MSNVFPTVKTIIRESCEQTGLDFHNLWNGENKGSLKLSAIIETAGYDADTHYPVTSQGKEQCWNCISNSFKQYLRSYPASKRYKIKLHEELMDCLQYMMETYHLVQPDRLQKAMKAPTDEDSTAVLLKCLHDRSGVTVRRLQRKLGKSRTAVLDDLKRLNSSRSNADLDPLQFAGISVSANIETWKNGSERAIRYCTPETIHPLAMLLNLSQVGELLRSLYYAYSEKNSQISYRIALNIWMQLSAYCRDKVAVVYGNLDDGFLMFLEELKDDAESGEVKNEFLSEPEMIRDGFVNRREEFVAAIKGGLHFRIMLQNCQEWIDSTQIQMLQPEQFRATVHGENADVNVIEFAEKAIKKFEYLEA